MLDQDLNKIRTLIAKSEISQALQESLKSEELFPLQNEIILLKSRFQKNEQALLFKTIDDDRYDATRNQIAHSLLEMISSPNKQTWSSEEMTSYNQIVNPNFGRPVYEEGRSKCFKYKLSIPAGFKNLNKLQISDTDLIKSLEKRRPVKDYIILTCTNQTNLARIWNLNTGELIQDFFAEDEISDLRFEEGNSDVLGILGQTGIIRFDLQTNVDNFHGIKWTLKKQWYLPDLPGFTDPKIIQLEEARSAYTFFVLVRDIGNENTPDALVKISTWNSQYTSEIAATYPKRITRIKVISNRLVVGINEPLQLLFIGGEEYHGKDAAMMPHNGEIVAISSDVKGWIYYLGINLAPQTGEIIKGDKEKYEQVIPYWTRYPYGNIERVGQLIGGYREHILLAISTYREFQVFNPFLLEAKRSGKNLFPDTFEGHSAEIIQMSWEGRTKEEEYELKYSFFSKSTKTYYGQYLVTSSEDGEIKVWHIESNQLLGTFENCHTGQKAYMLLGNYFSYADRYGFVHVFEIDDQLLR
jgi:WD40 repeat protein